LLVLGAKVLQDACMSNNQTPMTLTEAKQIINENRCGLSTTRPGSGRIAMCSRASDLEKSVRYAMEKNKTDLIEALKVYVEIELSKVQPLYRPALVRAMNATSPRNKKIYGSRYDRIVNRLSLFESLQKLLNNKN
jgi:hypothetical protein